MNLFFTILLDMAAEIFPSVFLVSFVSTLSSPSVLRSLILLHFSALRLLPPPLAISVSLLSLIPLARTLDLLAILLPLTELNSDLQIYNTSFRNSRPSSASRFEVNSQTSIRSPASRRLHLPPTPTVRFHTSIHHHSLRRTRDRPPHNQPRTRRRS